MLSESRREYEVCFSQQTYAPLYAAPWWLDATCGKDQWDVLRLANTEDRGNILLPVYTTRIRGLRSIITPPLTQWLPVLATEETTTVNLQNILSAIPGYPILDLTFKPGQHLLPPDLPFQNRMRYSYVVFPAKDQLATRKGYNEGLRRNLKEAVNLYTIEESEDAGLLLQLCRDSYKQRGMKEPAFFAGVLPEVIKTLKQQHRGRLRMAYDNGKAIAGVLTGWDDRVVYYLAGGRADTASAASAHALLLDEAISAAQETQKEFDFEGSMHPGIANFFQSFGATPVPYWHVRKYNGIGKIWSLFQ